MQDPLGTARTIIVDAGTFPRIGNNPSIRVLRPHDPLQNGEVVLTFDDGPELPCTEIVLESLKNEGVRATFFFMGYRARHLTQLAQQVEANGHSIGTHTNIHRWLPSIVSLAEQITEIEDGISSVASALGKQPAQFFRFPFLQGTPTLEQHLASKRIVIWDTDVEANDAFGVSIDEVVDKAISGLRTLGKGVLLLHDIQPVTALALPRLLRELKRWNFNVVHAVSA